jgi:methylglyoxal synthase
MTGQLKTVIGVLASRDSELKNDQLAELFERKLKNNTSRVILSQFHFIFTGGTFDRVVTGDAPLGSVKSLKNRLTGRKRRIYNDFVANTTRLPDHSQGGVIILAQMVVHRSCRIIWSFFDPMEAHWLRPENLALLRLADVWKARVLMNPRSVENWIDQEAEEDVTFNLTEVPPSLKLSIGEEVKANPRVGGGSELKRYPRPSDLPETVALIAHDEMKERMIDFVVEYEREIDNEFKHILATATTGTHIKAVAPSLEQKLIRVQSGPKGGDIEIATDILYGRCHHVIFFTDPLSPHPHLADIRTVFAACMLQDDVRVFTTDYCARLWAERVRRSL